MVLTEITLKVSAKKPFQNTIIIYNEDIKIVANLFDQILSSSNEISAAAFIPEEPNNKKYTLSKDKVFKFNDLDQLGSFLAMRIEGDQKSVEERIKGITSEMNLKTLKLATCHYLDSIPKKGNYKGLAFRDIKMERNILQMTQDLKIGAQFGGKYFCNRRGI